MSDFQKVLKHTFIQFGGKFLGLGLGFLTTLFLLRYLQDQLYGEFTTVMAYLHFAVVLIDLGLYFVLVKRISDSKENSSKIFNNVFTLRLVSGIVALTLFSIIVWFIPVYSVVIKWGVLITALNFLFILLIQVLQVIFQKHIKMGLVALAEFLSKLFLFLTTVAVIYILQTGLYSIFLVVVLAAFVNFIILFVAAQKYQKIYLAFDFKIWKQVIAESWPMGLSIAFSLIYFKVDTFILSLYRPFFEVGIYGAVYKILEVIVTIPVMFVGLVLPILSKNYLARNFRVFKEYFQKSFNTLSLLALPILAGTFVVAEPLMLLITGQDFTSQEKDLGIILKILIIAVTLIFWHTLFTYLMVTIKKQKAMLVGYMFVAVSSLILYLIFIPKFSYFGAATITVYSELSILLISYYILHKAIKTKIDLKIFSKALLASFIMAILLWNISFLPVLVVILVGIVIYIGLLNLLGALSLTQIKELIYESRK